jgi:hypothetical protein
LGHFDVNLAPRALEHFRHQLGLDIEHFLEIFESAIEDHHYGVREVLGRGRVGEFFLVLRSNQIDHEERFYGAWVEETIGVCRVDNRSVGERSPNISEPLDLHASGQELTDELVVVVERFLAQR